MRRFIPIFILIILSMICLNSGIADEMRRVEIPSVSINVNLPQDTTIMTREKVDDSYLEEFNTTVEDEIVDFELFNYYLQAFNDDYAFYIKAFRTVQPDFASISDYDRFLISYRYFKKDEDQDTTETRKAISINHQPYIKTIIKSPSMNTIRYETVRNGLYYEMRFLAIERTKEIEKIEEDIIDSIEYIAKNSSTWTDDVLNISFELPNGWKEEPLNQENDLTKAKFVLSNTGDYFTYGYEEYWTLFTNKEKAVYKAQGITEENISLSNLLPYDREGFSIEGMKSTFVTINGMEYVRLDPEETSTIKAYMYMWIEKGKLVILTCKEDYPSLLDNIIASIKR